MHSTFKKKSDVQLTYPQSEVQSRTPHVNLHTHLFLHRPCHWSTSGRLKVSAVWDPLMWTHFHPSPSIILGKASLNLLIHRKHASIPTKERISYCLWEYDIFSIIKGFDFIALMRSCLDLGVRNFTHTTHLPFPTTYSFLFNFHYCPLPFALPPWQGFPISFPVFFLSVLFPSQTFFLSSSLSKYGHGGSVFYSRLSSKAPHWMLLSLQKLWKSRSALQSAAIQYF